MTTYRIFVDGIPYGVLSMKWCSTIDNVCLGQEDHGSDFFMYVCLLTNSHVRIPFDELTMGVLHTLNVTPTQLHLNSWASLHAFRVLTEMFQLKPSPHVFCISIVLTLVI